MKVRQLVGRLAGQIVDMPFHVAQACLANGTAAHPDAAVRIRGQKPIEPGVEEVEVTRMVTAETMQTKKQGRRKGRRQ